MGKNLARTSLTVTVILLVSYFIAFLREATIASYWGVSADVDAYTVAITIPINLFSIITLSIQSIVIPVYSDQLYNRGKSNSDRYISLLLNTIIVIALGLIVIFEFLASPIAYLFAPGLSPSSHQLVVSLMRLTLPTILFSLVVYVFTGILNVHKSFIWPAISIYILNLSVIVLIVILHSLMGIASACLGQVIGVMLQFLFLFCFARKHFKYEFVFNLKDEAIIETGKKVMPVMWSTCLSEINSIVNRAIASLLFVGAIASIGYATKINSVLMSFFTSAIATVVYPLYAESGAKRDIKQLNSRVNLTLSAYTLFLIPLMICVICLKRELVGVAFARGAFDINAVDITQSILGCYAPGILFLAFRETLTKVFYSVKDMSTPAKNATYGIVLNILLSVTLPFILGVEGLAIAASVSAAFISIRLVLLLLKKHQEIELNYFYLNAKRLILPSISMVIGIIGIRNIVSLSELGILISCSTVGIIIFISLSLLFKVQILYRLFKMVKNR